MNFISNLIALQLQVVFLSIVRFSFFAGLHCKDFWLLRKEAFRVRPWNFAWLLFTKGILALWCKIDRNWGTRDIFILIKISCILPPLETVSEGVFKINGLINHSTFICQKIKTLVVKRNDCFETLFILGSTDSRLRRSFVLWVFDQAKNRTLVALGPQF